MIALKRILPLVLIVALAGCAASSVPFPTPAQQAADAATQHAALLASGLDPATLWEDEDLANTYACDVWLNSQFQRAAAFNEVEQLGTLGSGAVGLIHPAAGFVGSLVTSALTTLANAGTLPYSAQTAPQVRSAMQAYAQAATAPATVEEAAMLGEGQLYLCTPPGATEIAGTAISTASITAGSPTASAAFALTPGPRAFAPPKVQVNGH
jgi:hypothetical protein